MSEAENERNGVNDKTSRGESPKKKRHDERFERQAQALRENLRRRKQQRRKTVDPASRGAVDETGG